MATKNFSIQKSGLLRGGKVSYDVDAVTGNVRCWGEIYIGFGITKTKTFDETYSLKDPTVLQSSRFQTVGEQIPIGDVLFTVNSIEPGAVMVKVEVQGKPIKGTARILTVNPVIELDTVDAEVTAYGMTVNVAVRPA